MRRLTWLWTSMALLALYVGYVVWGKYAKVIGPPPVKLGETGEFLLFLSSVLAFALQVIVEERRKAPKPGEHG